MNKFIDTHCHFDFPVFYNDIANSLSLAHQAQVKKNHYSCSCSLEF
ncbi:hypothetical protein PROPEN_01131 [Proteus penneri ATCC 35198]|nr:hypothetical protein PROPEN_01131 [Proteus penneri ATCC 35198]